MARHHRHGHDLGPARRPGAAQQSAAAERGAAAAAAKTRRASRESRGTDASYVAALKEQLSYLEMECAVLKNSRQQQQQQHVQLHGGKAHSVVSTRSCMDDSLSELMDRCRQLEAEHRAEIKHREAEQEALLREISDLRTEVECRKEDQRLVRKRAEDIASERAASLERECARLAKDIVEQQSARERLEAALVAQRAAEESFATERARREASESRLEAQVTDLSAQLAAAKTRVADLEGSCGVDRVRLVELEDKHTSFAEETGTFRMRTEAAEESAKQLSAELARTRNHLQKAEERAQTLAEENDQLVEANAGLHENLRKLQHQLSGSAGREAEASKQRDAALKQAATQAVQYESMKQELERAQDFLQAEATRHRRESEAFADARARIEVLETNLRAKAQAHADGEAHRKRVEDHMGQLVAQNASLKAQLDAARVQTEAAEGRALEAEQARVWALQKHDEDADERVENRAHQIDLDRLQHVMQSQIAATLGTFLKQERPISSSSSLAESSSAVTSQMSSRQVEGKGDM